MKFVIALVSYLESLGYDTSSLRKSADGSKAIVHMQYAEILSKNLDTNANVTIYDRVNPDFQALLASDEWNGNVTGTPNSFGDLAELAKYEARLTAQVTEAKTDMDNFQIEIAGEVTTAKEDLNAIVDNYQVTVNQQLEQIATNVKDFGAFGDGVTDDTIQIQNALDSLVNGGDIFIPAGVYMISSTLIVHDRTRIFGAGIGTTTLKAFPNTHFLTYAPYEWENQGERTKYRSLMKTDMDSQSITFERFTIDFNHSPTNHVSSAPLAILGVKNSVVSEIEIKNVMQSGWEERQDLDYGDRNSGCSILYAFTTDSICEKSIFHSAEYETVSIRYLSKNINFVNNYVYAENSNAHAIQTARPSSSGLGYIENVNISYNVFYVKNSQDAIALHGSRDININNNMIYLMESPNKRVRAMVRMVDLVENVNIKDNLIDMRNWDIPQPLSAIILDEGTDSVAGSKRNINVESNMIKANYVDGEYTMPLRQRPTIGGTLGTNIAQVNINSNQIDLYGFPRKFLAIIALNATEFSINNNKIMIVNGLDGSADLPEGIVITEGRRGYITGNTVNNIGAGRLYNGVVIEQNVHDTVIIGNMFAHRVSNRGYINRSPNTIIIEHNIGLIGTAK